VTEVKKKKESMSKTTSPRAFGTVDNVDDCGYGVGDKKKKAKGREPPVSDGESDDWHEKKKGRKKRRSKKGSYHQDISAEKEIEGKGPLHGAFRRGGNAPPESKRKRHEESNREGGNGPKNAKIKPRREETQESSPNHAQMRGGGGGGFAQAQRFQGASKGGEARQKQKMTERHVMSESLEERKRGGESTRELPDVARCMLNGARHKNSCREGPRTKERTDEVYTGRGGEGKRGGRPWDHGTPACRRRRFKRNHE